MCVSVGFHLVFCSLLQRSMSSDACSLDSSNGGLEHAATAQLLFYFCMQVPDDAKVSMVKMCMPVLWDAQRLFVQ